MNNVTRHRERSHDRASAQLISEAVVASYIRDISGRHRRQETANKRALRELRRPVHRLAAPSAAS